MSAREIRRQIRELKAEMKELGVKRFSCFMGGHTDQSYRYNAELFRLSVELRLAIEQERKPKPHDLPLPPLFCDN